MHKVLGVAANRLPRTEPEGPGEEGPDSAGAREEVAALLARRGWQVAEDNPAARSLAGVLAALHRAGHGGFVELLDVYADAAEPVAQADLGYVRRRVAREDLVESVVGTVLGEAVFGALRRLVHVDASARAYEGGQEAEPGGRG